MLLRGRPTRAQKNTAENQGEAPKTPEERAPFCFPFVARQRTFCLRSSPPLFSLFLEAHVKAALVRGYPEQPVRKRHAVRDHLGRQVTSEHREKQKR